MAPPEFQLDLGLTRISGEEFSTLLSLERSHSVIGYANYFVASEFLSHLADRSDSAFAQSTAALRRMWAHCKQYDGALESLRFVADSEAQTARVLFGRSPANRAREVGLFAHLIGEIVNDDFQGSALSKYAGTLSAIAAHNSAVEKQFVEDLWAIVQQLRPGAELWADVVKGAELRKTILEAIERGESHWYISSALAYKAAHQLGIELV